MSFSDYTENKILNHLLRTATWSKPSSIYVSLHTADPTDAGTGTEVSGGSYARVDAGAPDDANWDGGTGTAGTSTNLNTITFPTATGSWGTVTHFALFDASTSGNCLGSGALGTSKSITTGDTASFGVGTLSVVVG